MFNSYAIYRFGMIIPIAVEMFITSSILIYLICMETSKRISEIIEKRNNQFETYMKSQKVIYSVNKSILEKIENKFNMMEELVSKAKEELINNDKAIAKTIIKRNNEQLGEIKYAITNIELKPLKANEEKYNPSSDIVNMRDNIVDSINNLSNEFTGVKEILNDNLKVISERQNNILNKLENITVSNMTVVSNKEEEIEQSYEIAEEQIADSVAADSVAAEELVTEEQVTEEINSLSDEAADKKDLYDLDVIEKEVPEIDIPEIDLYDPNKQLSADEIAALFANIGN